MRRLRAAEGHPGVVQADRQTRRGQDRRVEGGQDALVGVEAATQRMDDRSGDDLIRRQYPGVDPAAGAPLGVQHDQPALADQIAQPAQVAPRVPQPVRVVHAHRVDQIVGHHDPVHNGVDQVGVHGDARVRRLCRRP